MKTVLITGANSGFGYGLSKSLLERGWRVIAGVRNLEPRRHLFADLDRTYSHHLELLELDLEKPSDWDRPLKLMSERRIELDCLVNNAGFGVFGPLEDISETQLRKQFEVNFFGLFLLTQKLLPSLRKTKGRIINLSSTVGFTGLPLGGPYVASKFAVEGMSECLALDLKKFGVQVCLVQPGAFKTSFGANVAWAEKSNSDESVYLDEVKATQRFRSPNRKSPDPEIVIKTLVSLCEQRVVPLRKRVGKDASLAYWSRKLLPQAIYHWLLSWVFSQAQKKRTG